MKSKLFKQSIALLACAVVSLSILPAGIANAQTQTKDASFRSILSRPKISFDQESIKSGEAIKVTITFFDTINREVPFKIELTNGAMILANNKTDVEFITNSEKKEISNIKVNEDASGMSLVTGICSKNKRSTFTFEVKAPVNSTTFQVILNTDSLVPNYKTVISENIIVTSGLD